MTDQDKANILPLEKPAAPAEKLPYRIELWDADRGETVERVLARAFNAMLALAIFKAAQTEHPDRRITLRLGERMIADTRDL